MCTCAPDPESIEKQSRKDCGVTTLHWGLFFPLSLCLSLYFSRVYVPSVNFFLIKNNCFILLKSAKWIFLII